MDVAEHAPVGLEQQGLVVDGQDAAARVLARRRRDSGAGVGASAARAARGGQAHAEGGALAGRLSTVISPPSARTMPERIGSPSPVPMPRGLVVKNDSKMRGNTSAGIPGPLS